MSSDPQAPLILIAGGSRGVGAATARLAAAQRYDVAISFASKEPAALAVVRDVEAAGRRALAVRADSPRHGSRRRLMCERAAGALPGSRSTGTSPHHGRSIRTAERCTRHHPTSTIGISDWLACRLELRCPGCTKGTFIPIAMLLAKHGDRTFRRVLRSLRCSSCGKPPAPVFLLAWQHREHSRRTRKMASFGDKPSSKKA